MCYSCPDWCWSCILGFKAHWANTPQTELHIQRPVGTPSSCVKGYSCMDWRNVSTVKRMCAVCRQEFGSTHIWWLTGACNSSQLQRINAHIWPPQNSLSIQQYTPRQKYNLFKKLNLLKVKSSHLSFVFQPHSGGRSLRSSPFIPSHEYHVHQLTFWGHWISCPTHKLLQRM